MEENMQNPKESNQTAFVTLETSSDIVKRRNLFYASGFIGFVWMLFHFTVVFFFTLELKSPVIVGLFLGLGNLVALILDVPISIVSRYFSPKKLFLFASISMLGAGLIFLKFIYAASFFTSDASTGITTFLGQFLDSTTNILLLIIAAGLYGFTKETNDLTTLSYILNNSDPSEYSAIVSRNNIFTGCGALIGLLASGFILSLNPTAAIITLNVFIVLLIIFIFTYFDSSDKSLSIQDVAQLKVIAKRTNIEKLKEYAVGYMAKADFGRLAQETKLIFLRPKKIELNFDPKTIVPDTIVEFKKIIHILRDAPLNLGLIWFVFLVLAFGVWDTFATSFLIDYLSGLPNANGFAYALLGIIAIPAFVTQGFFIKLATKIGRFSVVVFGLTLSGVSLLLFGFFEGIIFVLLFGLLNSIGYAAGMGLAQGGFLEFYNSEYAKKQNLTEIDSNASASPMKIVQNLANVIGLTIGGFVLGILGYHGFFILFGILLLSVAIYSFLKKAFLTEV